MVGKPSVGKLTALRGMESEAHSVAARWSEAGASWNPTEDLSWRKEADSNPWIGAVALMDAEGNPLTSFNRHKAAEDDPEFTQEIASSQVTKDVFFRGTHLGTVIVYSNPGLMWMRAIDGLLILLAETDPLQGAIRSAIEGSQRRSRGRAGNEE